MLQLLTTTKTKTSHMQILTRQIGPCFHRPTSSHCPVLVRVKKSWAQCCPYSNKFTELRIYIKAINEMLETGSITSTCTMWLTTTSNSSSRGFNALFWPPKIPGMNMVGIHTYRQKTHIHKFYLTQKCKHVNSVPSISSPDEMGLILKVLCNQSSQVHCSNECT